MTSSWHRPTLKFRNYHRAVGGKDVPLVNEKIEEYISRVNKKDKKITVKMIKKPRLIP